MRKIEALAKFHDSKKSMILNQIEKEKQSFSVPTDGGLPKRVGEKVGGQTDAKGRFFSSKNFSIASLKRFSIIFLWVFFIFFILYFPNLKILPANQKSLNVFVWGDLLIPEILSEFEKETGITVHLSYFSSNEELQVKMMATDGEGYDLITPSGYSSKQLIDKGLIKPIDRSKFQFWNDLNPLLVGLPYDPQNEYTIPFEWEVYGLGIAPSYFQNRSFTPSWRAVYDESIIDYKIAALNDPVEAVALAAYYLYGDATSLSSTQFQEVRKLLLKQRNWVEAYSDSRGPYFVATGSCPIVVTTNAYARKICGGCANFDFVIPKEGTFITVENFAISKASTKDDHIYAFLNFLYKKEVMKAHFQTYGFLPAYNLSPDELKMLPYEKKLFEITPEEFSKFQLFQNLVPQQEVRNLWVEVKSF